MAWRKEDVRALKRCIADSKSDDTKVALRRALITLLYAHLEGGFKVAVTSYIRVVNEACLDASQCNPHIAASAWSAIFKDLANPSKRSDHFRKSLPDETKLHAFARHAEFVTSVRQYERMPVQIDDTKVVETEGNVDQVVIAKILYRLGFSPDALDKKFDDLQYLRALRNPIAHGEKQQASEAHCAKYEDKVFKVLSRVRDLLSKAIAERAYLRKAS
jgi:MAE_28990/MAE_18760-like HEPN